MVIDKEKIQGLLTMVDLAKIFNVSPSTIRNTMSKNPESLPSPVRYGRFVRWDPDVVDAWLNCSTLKNYSGNSKVFQRKVDALKIKKLLTVEDLAKLLELPVHRVRNDVTRVPEKLPPFIKIGGSVRWRPEVVKAWLKDQEDIKKKFHVN